METRERIYNKIYTPEKWKKVNKANKEILLDYLKELELKKLKNSTINQYQNDLRILFVYILEKCHNVSIIQLNRKDYRDFFLWLCNDLKLSNARINRIITVCKTLLDFLTEDEEYGKFYTKNQASRIKCLVPSPVKEIVFLDDEVIMRLYEKLMLEQRYGEATLLALAYDSGGRKNELIQVTKQSINKKRNSTNEVIGKGGKIFSLIYFDRTKEACQAYLKQRGKDNIDALFVTQYKAPGSAGYLYSLVTKWRKDLYVLTGKEYKINLHSIRHSCLQNMKDGTHYICKKLGIKEVPLDKLKLLANHNNVETTIGYLKDDSVSELEEFFKIKIEK